MRALPLAGVVLAMLASLGAVAFLKVEAAGPTLWPDARDAALVAQGQALVAANCTACHGEGLGGQPGWQRSLPDGSVAAPPLDASGRAWQRSDAQLFSIIADGPEAPDAVSPMPAYRATLRPQEIWAVIANLKSRWPDGARAFQALLNPAPRNLPDPDGPWTFPTSF